MSEVLSDNNLADRITSVRDSLNEIKNYLDSPIFAGVDNKQVIEELKTLVNALIPASNASGIFTGAMKDSERLQTKFDLILDLVHESDIAKHRLNIPDSKRLNTKTVLGALEDLSIDFDLIRFDYDLDYRDRTIDSETKHCSRSMRYVGAACALVGIVGGLLMGKFCQKAEPQPASEPILQIAPAVTPER